MKNPDKNIEEIISGFSEDCAQLRDPRLSDEERSKLEHSFNEDYIRLYHYIQKFIYSKFRSTLAHKIEDIAQDIILKIISRPKVFHSDMERPKAFLNKTIFNRCIDEIRKPIPGVLEDNTPSEDVEDPIVKVTLEKNVVPELDDICRELLIGSYLGKTIEQMKKESKNPKSIHHPNLRRCREHLKNLLKKHELTDIDLQVLAKFLCEALENFSNQRS